MQSYEITSDSFQCPAQIEKITLCRPFPASPTHLSKPEQKWPQRGGPSAVAARVVTANQRAPRGTGVIRLTPGTPGSSHSLPISCQRPILWRSCVCLGESVPSGLPPLPGPVRAIPYPARLPRPRSASLPRLTPAPPTGGRYTRLCRPASWGPMS